MGWWFLGPGGYARLTDAHVADDGTLLPHVERELRDRGLFRIPTHHAYSLTVLTSTDCNLGCGYCYQNTGQDSTGGHRPPRIAHARLTSQTITSILEFAAKQMARADLNRLSIILFGGEPLLNPRGCRELLTRAADYGLTSATMVSNGTLLTPLLAKELADLGLREVQITFDGERTMHDQIRIRRSGGGTFDAIVHNLVQASAVTEIEWRLRVHVSHHNYGSIDALVEQLGAALDTSRCSLYFAWIEDVGVGYHNELRRTEELARSFGRWQRRALELGFTVPRPRSNRPCSVCSFRDGRYAAMVNADGLLFSCFNTVGKPGWEVGSVDQGYLPSEVTAGRWLSCEDLVVGRKSDRARMAFKDKVDANLLDHLSDTGRL